MNEIFRLNVAQLEQMQRDRPEQTDHDAQEQTFEALLGTIGTVGIATILVTVRGLWLHRFCLEREKAD